MCWRRGRQFALRSAQATTFALKDSLVICRKDVGQFGTHGTPNRLGQIYRRLDGLALLI